MSDRVAVVTGAARGFGRAISQRLQADGFRVCGWDLAPCEAEDGKPAPEFALSVTADVSDAGSVGTAAETTLAQLGRIDVLVNNAGVNGPTVPSWEYPLADWHRVIAVDLTGVFLCCQAIIPHMLERGSGRIVNIASVAGKEGNANAAPYCAAKAGVLGLTKAIARELATSGILINCVTPAMAETDLLREMSTEYIEGIKAKIPMGRLCQVEEVAEMTAYLASDRVTFTTGAAFDLSGGRADY